MKLMFKYGEEVYQMDNAKMTSMDERNCCFEVPVDAEKDDFNLDMLELCTLAKKGVLSFNVYPALGHAVIRMKSEVIEFFEEG